MRRRGPDAVADLHPVHAVDDAARLSRLAARLLVELDLVEQVAPIQLAIRLLIPAGSRLLELAEVREMVGPFDPTALVYPWQHRGSGDGPALRGDSEADQARKSRRKATRRADVRRRSGSWRTTVRCRRISIWPPRAAIRI